jgi:hypothetical protein
MPERIPDKRKPWFSNRLNSGEFGHENPKIPS